MVRALAIVSCLVACSAPPPPPASVAPRPSPDAAIARAPDLSACVLPADAASWGHVTGFLGAAWVPRVRVVAATPGPEVGQERCVSLELELVESFRGNVPPGRIHVDIRQSMVTHWTSRPAGAWWIVEQSLEVGSEYVALCPAAEVASLRAACSVSPAAPLLADLALVRELEATPVALAAVVARVRASCASGSGIAAAYVWDKFGAAAVADPAAYDAIVGLVEDRTCARIARATLFNAVQDLRVAESPPHVHRLARAMFRLLAMPEAADLHDNLVGTWLPNTLGLVGGNPHQTVAGVFGADATGRTAAIATIRAYQGREDATVLRTWFGLR